MKTQIIPILYEDQDIVVINKPAGIVVNRSETTKEDMTIQDWAENKIGITYKVSTRKYGDEDWNPEDEFYNRGGIVHRLDKETSGVLIIAKTPKAFVNLQKQFRERLVKKTYLALVHGTITPKEGEIHAPVGRLPWNRKRFGILPGGREAKTQYKVRSLFENPQTKEKLSLVALYPQSGRTHQIRVHLQHIHHPIFADSFYAGRKTARNDRKVLDRVFLHAAEIFFNHPVTEKEVSYTAPLPEELEEVIENLNICYT